MHTLEPDLPKHLYIESRDSDGNLIDITYTAEKLVSWAEYRNGAAIDRWCRDRLDRDIEAIDTWEEGRYLALEEQWLEQEDGSDDDAAEARYEKACQVIADRSAHKRARAMERMQQHREDIDKLVAESREHLAAHQPAEADAPIFGILLAIGAAATLGYVLLT